MAPPVASSPAESGTLFRLTLALAPCLVVLLTVLQSGIDWDVWWHLRTGQWIVQHHAVPTSDPFTIHGPETPWIAYSWLFEVMLWEMYSVLGLRAVLLYQVILALAVVAAFHRLVARREPRFLPAIILTTAASVALSLLLKQRSWLFSILFTTLTLDVILDLRRGRRNGWTWVLPFLYVLWAGIHIQFIYGLALLGLAALLPSPKRRSLILLTLLCAVATLVNPYHVSLYGVVWEYATQMGPYRFINELKAPEFRDVSSWTTLALAALSVFALGRRSQLDLFDVVLLAGAAVLAFRARRDLWLLTLASTAVLACSDRPARATDRFDWTLGRVLALTALVGLLAGLLWRVRDLSEERLQAAAAETFPVEAVQIVRERGYRGPLFHDLDWGGYVIWALPEYPAVIDGRTNLHGDARLQRSLDTWAGRPGWDDDADLKEARLVIARSDSPLTALLLRDAAFECVHVDPVATVFVRKSEPDDGERRSIEKDRR
jgi:hypothetical protein